MERDSISDRKHYFGPSVGLCRVKTTYGGAQRHFYFFVFTNGDACTALTQHSLQYILLLNPECTHFVSRNVNDLFVVLLDKPSPVHIQSAFTKRVHSQWVWSCELQHVFWF